MEAIMQQLFQLPRSSEKAVYYAVLVAGMCRIISDGFPAAMGKSVKILFSRLDYVGGGGGGSGDDDDAAMALDSSSSSSTSNAASGMDVDCARRFGEWFALHLSNFKYIWKWDDW